MISLHAFAEYIKYRFTAIGRHGLHSPFAYHLVDNCLLARTKDTLQERLVRHFGAGNIIWLPQEQPEKWQDLAVPDNDKVIIIPAIHSTSAHTQYWNTICTLPGVTMSIDIYNYGILLFNPDFLVKQHFVLKRY